jgi:hypothetical protein
MRPSAASAVFVFSAMAASGTWPVRGQAQSAPTPQAPPTFRAGVNVVELDVSVLDKQRRPVKGLTATDFTVLVHEPHSRGGPPPSSAYSCADFSGLAEGLGSRRFEET